MNTRQGDSNLHSFWIVNESNPWPDPYIAIIFGEAKQLSIALKKDHTIYYSLHEALKQASALKKKYGVKQIRLFYPNQVSIIVKSN